METQVTKGTYLYAVMPAASGVTFKASAVGASTDKDDPRVRLIEEGDLAAVVSDAPLQPHDPTRANLTAHQRVVEEALERSEILPVRFGTVAGGDPEIKQFLRDKHDDLSGSLERLRGRVELALKVLWDQDVILAELLSEDEEIRAMRDELASLNDAQTQDQRIELGRRVTEALEEKRKAEGDRIVEMLGPRAVDVAVNRLQSEDMILNAGFLVESKAIRAFDDAVNALAAEQKGRLTLKYVGPLAPYDFVNIVVGKG